MVTYCYNLFARNLQCTLILVLPLDEMIDSVCRRNKILRHLSLTHQLTVLVLKLLANVLREVKDFVSFYS